jgi:hypothetical protein
MYSSSIPRRLVAVALLAIVISSTCATDVWAEELVCPTGWTKARGKWVCECPDGTNARGSDNGVMRCATEGPRYQPSSPAYPPSSNGFGSEDGAQYQATAPNYSYPLPPFPPTIVAPPQPPGRPPAYPMPPSPAPSGGSYLDRMIQESNRPPPGGIPADQMPPCAWIIAQARGNPIPAWMLQKCQR